MTATQLRILSRLADAPGGLPQRDIEQPIVCSPKGTRLLIEGLARQGLVRREGGVWQVTAAGRQRLQAARDHAEWVRGSR